MLDPSTPQKHCKAIMNVLLAFDKYKDSLDAEHACERAVEVVLDEQPDSAIRQIPLSDGGEGFTRILTLAANGRLETVQVAGPRFHRVDAHYGLVAIENLPEGVAEQLKIPASGQLAVIEMAQAAGLERLDKLERNPWKTSTYGVGELIQHAVNGGADAILLGIGGSATNDCGVGALEALGLQFYDRELQPVARVVPATWKRITSLGSTLKLPGKMPPVRIACDVRNPLLGEHGATRVFGPQKGLRAEDTDRLERLMEKMARRLLGCFGKPWDDYAAAMDYPGSGAAGGIAFGLRTALADVELVAGSELFDRWCRLRDSIDWADWIFTGEGRLDAGTLNGKGPGLLIQLAAPDQRISFLAGSVDADTADKLTAGHPKVWCEALSPTTWPLEKALRATPAQLALKVREHLRRA